MALSWIIPLLLLTFEPSVASSAKDGEISFPRGTLKIAGQNLRVEIAESHAQHERGLMFRESLPEGEGMLFIFEDEAPRSFWMKNTFVELSIGYFNKDRVLIDVQDMKAVRSVMETPRTYPSRGAAKYALEVPQGWFKKTKVGLGARFELSRN